jgi:uncharacterized membrane protein YfcA
MTDFLYSHFLVLTLSDAVQVVILGFIGGVLSGFIGSGGAFFMTPGMMNLGVPGAVAVASNIAHKFGKAMMGSRKHAEMGNVDMKIGAFMVFTAFVGIRIAVWLNSMFFAQSGDGHGTSGSAASNLYISMVFVSILSVVGLCILRDALGKSQDEGTGPSRIISDYLGRLRLPPTIYFPVSDVRVSLWVIMAAGLATGYLAGTIGVGGFIGVPAMIYVFGMPTAVAAGSELFIAMLMGAFGAINYAFEGLVDIRLTLLLYLGSLVGVYVGAYGTKVVKEVLIRLVTGMIILLCVLSRALAIPVYLRELGYVTYDPAYDVYFNQSSKLLLLASGITGVGVILFHVIKAYRNRMRVRASLGVSAPRMENA